MSDQLTQEQFLEVIPVEEAHRRWNEALGSREPVRETVAITEAVGRVLIEDVHAPVNVPSFDRSNVDGFAVRASDTWGASESEPVSLELLERETITPGVLPASSVASGGLIPIATGAPIPRGADSVVMVEYTRLRGEEVLIERSVAPGANITFAGTDITRNEVIGWRGSRVTARDAGVFSAAGIGELAVTARPRVAIISTGDELIAPGTEHRPGSIYDSNSVILEATIEELGGEVVSVEIVRDDEDSLRGALKGAVANVDLVLLSGGTSKGGGDLSYRVVSELDPGIVVHGVALKPGKPVCLALAGAVPVVILPGFPTSAIFTFHEFVAPLIGKMADSVSGGRLAIEATSAVPINSERGRTEFSLVILSEDGAGGLVAYPIGKGSGSVTTFSRADGFLRIERQQELVERDARVEVTLLDSRFRPAELMSIGSSCTGLDHLFSILRARGRSIRTLTTGSQGGVSAARRGECDVAGVHLYDEETGEWNTQFATDDVAVVRGYGRMQGLCFRKDDERFDDSSWRDAIRRDDVRMVNRTKGAGTRVLIDQILEGHEPEGYVVQVRSHHAVAAAVEQERADWGVCTRSVARDAGLGFIEIAPEQFDFLIPRARLNRPAVRELLDLLRSAQAHAQLKTLGFSVPADIGTVIGTASDADSRPSD